MKFRASTYSYNFDFAGKKTEIVSVRVLLGWRGLKKAGRSSLSFFGHSNASLALENALSSGQTLFIKSAHPHTARQALQSPEISYHEAGSKKLSVSTPGSGFASELFYLYYSFCSRRKSQNINCKKRLINVKVCQVFYHNVKIERDFELEGAL